MHSAKKGNSCRSQQAYLGLDLGTQGVRCVGVVETGEVVGLVEHALAPPLPTSPGRSEQDAEGWWVACCEA
ncbi:MAG: hypothetical protein N2512_07845, partial [Armatimonadetes bacterium]|nr:hypothetical protein [Armatimonadota bacterium]